MKRREKVKGAKKKVKSAKVKEQTVQSPSRFPVDCTDRTDRTTRAAVPGVVGGPHKTHPLHPPGGNIRAKGVAKDGAGEGGAGW